MRSLVYILLLCFPLMAEEFRCFVVTVNDGDTITVLDAQKKQQKIRLDAIDAPERGQAFGTQAKLFLSNLVIRRNVRIVYSGEDRYGRTLGTVFIGEKNINLTLVEEGSASVPPDFPEMMYAVVKRA